MRAWCGIVLAVGVSFVMVACGLDDTAIIANSGNGGGDGSANGDGTVGGGDGGGTGGDSGGGDGGAGGDSGGPSGDSGPDAGSTPKLVYANNTTDLYSYDVVNDALAHVAILSSCGSNANDIAIDGTGQMYMNVANDAIYKLALDGTCSARNVLDAIAGDHLKIAARAAGTPSIITVDPQHPNLYSLDPNSMGHAHITSINNNELVDNPPYDIACDNAGTCWAFLSHTNCSAGSTNACLYSFPADGSSDAVFVASIAVLPEGLAYANGSLWAFDDIGDIYEVALAAPVMVTEKNPTHSGFAPPTTYTGAGSSSSY